MPSSIKEKDSETLSQSYSGKKLPLVIIETDSNEKNIDSKSLESLLEGLAHLDIKVEQNLKKNENLNEEAAIVIILSKNKGLLETAWEKGVVPVTSAFDQRIVNYNPNSEKGNSFVYNNFNEWEIFSAVVRALETHKFPYDWKFIKRSCMKSI